MRGFPIAILCLLLVGCESLPGWAIFSPPAEMSAPARYHFDWALSGSRAVGPEQVFDDGERTWLQFTDGAPIPAVFARSEQGDTPLSYRREGPYVVVRGVWPQLVLRGGHEEAYVRRVAQRPEKTVSSAPAAIAGTADTGAPPIATKTVAEKSGAGGGKSAMRDGATAPRRIVAGKDAAFPEASRQARGASAQVPGTAVDSRPAPAIPMALHSSPSRPSPVSVASSLSPGTTRRSEEKSSTPITPGKFEVDPTDGNIRQALNRWARMAGWAFNVEHWAVNVDVPIVGSATFDSEFKPAVQALLASTELGDRPLRPCFYSNKVVRVVPYAQVCDRTRNPASSS